MIPRGSIDDFGGAVEGPPPLECWECSAEFGYFHEADLHETATGHVIALPQAPLTSYSCGCSECAAQVALRQAQAARPIKRARVTWRR